MKSQLHCVVSAIVLIGIMSSCGPQTSVDEKLPSLSIATDTIEPEQPTHYASEYEPALFSDPRLSVFSTDLLLLK